MRRNGYLWTSVKNLSPPFAPATSISYNTLCISTTKWRLHDIFDVFVLLRRMTLWPWPLTFCPWECLMYSAAHVRPTYQFIILGLSIAELRVLNIWSHFRYLKQSLRMRRVTWPLTGAKVVHIFEIPDPNLPIHFVTFRALRRRLSHVIGEKYRFPIMKATKFTAHAQYHVTCA